jgi:hypothetical protein
MKVYHDNGEKDFKVSFRYLRWLLSNMEKRYKIMNLNINMDGEYSIIKGLRKIENSDDLEQFMIILSSKPMNERQRSMLISFLSKY